MAKTTCNQGDSPVSRAFPLPGGGQAQMEGPECPHGDFREPIRAPGPAVAETVGTLEAFGIQSPVASAGEVVAGGAPRSVPPDPSSCCLSLTQASCGAGWLSSEWGWR